MANKTTSERFKAFILRRKLNAFGLLAVTLLSLIITIICAVIGFKRTDVLIVVSVLLIALCFVQGVKLRSSFRTLPKGKALRKKRKN